MARQFTAVLAILLFAAIHRVEGQPATTPAPSTGSSVVMRCQDCGTIESIREVQQGRLVAPPGTPSDQPVGLVMYVPLGRTSTTASNETYVGSVGSRQFQERMGATRYEISVRLDNGNYQLLQRQGVPDFGVGDRVRVRAGQVELVTER